MKDEGNRHEERSGQEGLILGTDSDADFHSETFDEDFERRVNLKMQALIRKHWGWEHLPWPAKDEHQAKMREKFREWLETVEWKRKCKNRFYVPVKDPKSSHSWKALVGESKWKTGRSAKTLAYCWTEAKGFPPEVVRAFSESAASLFKDVEFLLGVPEHPVNLPGGANSPSTSDIFVLAKSQNALISIAVEGKVEEPFDELVEVWLGAAPSDGKKERLDFLLRTLELDRNAVDDIRYQLIHRSASAVLEAHTFNAPSALLLVHAFKSPQESYDDYSRFVGLFGLKVERNRVMGPAFINGIDLHFGWVDGDEQFLER